MRANPLVTALIIALIPCAASAQTADEIIGRYIEAIGGRDAIDGIETLVYTRELNHLEENSISSTVHYHKRPFFYRAGDPDAPRCIINRADDGRFWMGVKGDDGTRQWREIESTIHHAYILTRLGEFLDYDKRGAKAEFAGTVEIDSRAHYRVDIVWPDDTRWQYYFDSQTNLWSYFKPDETTTVSIHSYKEVGGVLFPHRTEGKGIRLDNGQEYHHINTITHLEINVPIDDSLFLPEG